MMIKDGKVTEPDPNSDMDTFDIESMPVVELMSAELVEKLKQYASIDPTPISIKEFMERSCHLREDDSYVHLSREVTIRLAHMIMELQHLPKPLLQMEKVINTIRLYTQSFTEILRYEDLKPDKGVLESFIITLKT